MLLVSGLMQDVASYVSTSSSRCITSFRHSHVFTANIARINSVTPRIRGSCNVLSASTAIAAYVNSARINCFVTTNQMVHREGFEPSYLARRDRFTVCWL